MIGTLLGPYRILSKIGEGGMGEVYKARDERLDRIVAVKVLPGLVAADPLVRSRFEREARTIASLSDPNICTLHDVGQQAMGDAPPIEYLVMEYLEGETLADRLARTNGPLPIDQVVSIGAIVAGALDRAHRAGITHRDLKPANVMLTKAGPKLLDFGLAKAAIGSGAVAETTKALTDAHAIVGTIHYMAPEQVEGRDADARSDIWALGAMLYEMATGQRPFAGDSAASVMSGILRDTVPLVSARQPLAPEAFDHLVDRCLQKDPDERWQHAGDIKRQLQWIAQARSGRELPAPSLPATARPRPIGGWMVAAACVIVGLGLGAGAMLLRPAPATTEAPRTALSIVPPPGVRAGTTFALSPDGRYFTFVGVSGDGPPKLWLRSLAETVARPIEGTEDASYPFWSPESDAIGFFATGKLKTTSVNGGVPRTIAPVANGRGGAWSPDGNILFGGQNSTLFRVSTRGGPVTAATSIAPNAVVTGHRWPTFVSPRQFIYTVQGSAADTGIFLATLGATDAPEALTLKKLNGLYSNTQFVDGRLIFVQDEMLVEQTLDLAAGTLVGTPREIVGPVQYTTGLGYAPMSAAGGRTIAYTEKSAAGAPTTLVWLDRQGKRLGSLGEDVGFGRDMVYNQRLSPDGRTVVLSAFRAATADIWLIDLARLASTRFTFSDANDQMAIFSPNGEEVVFGSNRNGPFNMYRKRLNGASEETRLFVAPSIQYPDFWSPDGSTIFYVNSGPKMSLDIWKIGSDGQNPTPVIATPFNEYSARLTSDGKWLAYTSDESGRPEIYVQSYPNATRKWQISTQGGSEPMWRANGRELFYVAANQMLNVVSVQTTPEFSASRPTKLSDVVIDTNSGNQQTTHYAVTADGERFLANVMSANPVPPTILTNWTSTSRSANAK